MSTSTQVKESNSAPATVSSSNSAITTTGYDSGQASVLLALKKSLTTLTTQVMKHESDATAALGNISLGLTSESALAKQIGTDIEAGSSMLGGTIQIKQSVNSGLKRSEANALQKQADEFPTTARDQGGVEIEATKSKGIEIEASKTKKAGSTSSAAGGTVGSDSELEIEADRGTPGDARAQAGATNVERAQTKEDYERRSQKLRDEADSLDKNGQVYNQMFVAGGQIVAAPIHADSTVLEGEARLESGAQSTANSGMNSAADLARTIIQSAKVATDASAAGIIRG